MLTILALIVIVSIPFGFLGGNGRFNTSICFIALGFMSLASLGLLIQPLLPGTQIQLREDAIVRVMSKRNDKSAYKDIDCIYFYRDSSYSWEKNMLIVNVHQRTVDGPNFTSFDVIMKTM